MASGAHRSRFSGTEVAAGVEQRLRVLRSPHRERVERAAGELAQALYLAYGVSAESQMKLRLRILDAVLPFPVVTKPDGTTEAARS